MGMICHSSTAPLFFLESPSGKGSLRHTILSIIRRWRSSLLLLHIRHHIGWWCHRLLLVHLLLHLLFVSEVVSTTKIFVFLSCLLDEILFAKQSGAIKGVTELALKLFSVKNVPNFISHLPIWLKKVLPFSKWEYARTERWLLQLLNLLCELHLISRNEVMSKCMQMDSTCAVFYCDSHFVLALLCVISLVGNLINSVDLDVGNFTDCRRLNVLLQTILFQDEAFRAIPLRTLVHYNWTNVLHVTGNKF